MNKYKRLETIMNNTDTIIFWGASDNATNKISKLVPTLSDKYNWGIADTHLAGKQINIRGTLIEVKKPEYYFDKNVKWVLCISSKQAYAEVFSTLEKNELVYGKDFIDGMNLGELSWEYPHSDIHENDVYSPWLSDSDYRSIRDQILNNTLVDEYRCYELYKLVQQSNKCIEGDALEIGVWKGGTGALISKTYQSTNESVEVYLADTFEGVVKAGEADIYYDNGYHSDTSIREVEALLKNMGIDNAKIYKGIFPDSFGNEFENKKWRFVHIDVDIYQSAKDIFEYIWKNVVSGGIVVFDDYGYITTVGVTKLCNELANSIEDGVFIYNLNQHGIFVKK